MLKTVTSAAANKMLKNLEEEIKYHCVRSNSEDDIWFDKYHHIKRYPDNRKYTRHYSMYGYYSSIVRDDYKLNISLYDGIKVYDDENIEILSCDKELEEYLRGYFADTELFYDLLNYQKKLITLPGKQSESIRTVYDWNNYFNHIFDDDFVCPEKKATMLVAAESSTDNWIDYAREIVWYGRRSGKTIRKITECIK